MTLGRAARTGAARPVAVPRRGRRGVRATFWGERPHVSTTGGFDDLFSAEAVDELLTHRGLRTPFLRMARDGTVLPESRYTASGGAGARIADQVDAAAVYREMNAGSTLVLQGLHRTWEPVRTFARQLVLDLGHPVQVNAYVTPAGSQGFASHYDTHDVLVLQIAGTKAWRMHEPVVPIRSGAGRTSVTEWRNEPRIRPTWSGTSFPATACTCRGDGCTRPPPRRT